MVPKPKVTSLKLPRKIRFCGFTYRVLEQPNLHDKELWGRTDTAAQTITLEKEISDERKMETLIHELLHIAWDSTGLVTKLEEREAESLVKAWATNIYGILKENGFLSLPKKEVNREKKRSKTKHS